jgi:hypothetical protein
MLLVRCNKAQWLKNSLASGAIALLGRLDFDWITSYLIVKQADRPSIASVTEIIKHPLSSNCGRQRVSIVIE